MATIDPPRAIRVKTSTGWADLAIKGAPGTPGVPRFDYLGGWSAATTYLKGQIIVRNGVTFLCVRDTTTQPPASWPSVASVPTPVVNGQWLKGVSGAVAWQPIVQSDLPTNLQATAIAMPSADYNSALANGWYVGLPTDANRPGDYYCHVQVFQFGGPQYLQIAYVYNADLSFIRRGTPTFGAWRTFVAGGDTAWHLVGAAGEPAFQNGWGNYGGWPPLGFRKDAVGTVHVKGLVSGGTVAGGVPIFTLPVGYRPLGPQGNRYAIVCNNAFGASNAYSDGRVDCEVGSNAYAFLNYSFSTLT